MDNMSEFYASIKDLQEQQHDSEERRLNLERQLTSYLSSSDRMAKLKAVRLQKYWQKVCADEKKAQQRQKHILRELDRMDAQLAELTARTERTRQGKMQFEAYVERTYPNWKERLSYQIKLQQIQSEQDWVQTKYSSQDVARISSSNYETARSEQYDQQNHGVKSSSSQRSSAHSDRQTGEPPSSSAGYHARAGHKRDSPVGLYSNAQRDSPVGQHSNGGRDSPVGLQNGVGRDSPNQVQHQPVTRNGSDTRVELKDNHTEPAMSMSLTAGGTASTVSGLSGNFQATSTPHQTAALNVQPQKTEDNTTGTQRKGSAAEKRLQLASDQDFSSGTEDNSEQPRNGKQSSGESGKKGVPPKKQPEDEISEYSQGYRPDDSVLSNITEREEDHTSSPVHLQLTQAGLFDLMLAIENYLQDSPGPQQVYSAKPRPAVDKMISLINTANSGGSLLGADVQSMSYTIVDQLQPLVAGTAGGALLPDSALFRLPSQASETLIKPEVPSSGRDLWERLVDHWLRLVLFKVLSTKQTATLFAPIVIAKDSPYESKAIEIVKSLLDGLSMDIITPRSSSVSATPRAAVLPDSDDDRMTTPRRSLMSPLTADDDSFYEQPPTRPLATLTQSHAYRQLLGASAHQSSHVDSDDEMERVLLAATNARNQPISAAQVTAPHRAFSPREGITSPDLISSRSTDMPEYIPSAFSTMGRSAKSSTMTSTMKRRSAALHVSDSEEEDFGTGTLKGAQSAQDDDDEFDFYA